MEETGDERETTNYGAGVIVVNAAGAVLLQLRDDPPPEFYHHWTIPGGGVEPGDGSLAETACREIAEETALTIAPAQLTHLFTVRWPSVRHPDRMSEYTAFAAPTAATQADVVCGEGADMRFHSPDAVRRLPLVARMQPQIMAFLESAVYTQMVGAAKRMQEAK